MRLSRSSDTRYNALFCPPNRSRQDSDSLRESCWSAQTLGSEDYEGVTMTETVRDSMQFAHRANESAVTVGLLQTGACNLIQVDDPLGELENSES
jgi:hypothetical protein